jgi:hypothetical protein
MKTNILKKELEEHSRRQKDLPCSWTVKLNIVNMAILEKEIYRFNAIPIKILISLFREMYKSGLKFIWKHKQSQIAKAILSKNSYTGGTTNLTSVILWCCSNRNTMVLAQKQAHRTEN